MEPKWTKIAVSFTSNEGDKEDFEAIYENVLDNHLLSVFDDYMEDFKEEFAQNKEYDNFQDYLLDKKLKHFDQDAGSYGLWSLGLYRERTKLAPIKRIDKCKYNDIIADGVPEYFVFGDIDFIYRNIRGTTTPLKMTGEEEVREQFNETKNKEPNSYITFFWGRIPEKHL